MQIAYFPYLNLINRDDISFGDYKVWNFSTKYKELIPGINLQEKVKKLIESNVSHGNALKNVGIFSKGIIDFHPLTDEELGTLEEVRLLLFLSFISKNNINLRGPNSGHYVATSENFTYAIQNFDPVSDFIAQKNGFIVQKLDGGYHIGELKFHAPPYVPAPLRFTLDEELIIKLLRVKKTNSKLYNRILRATDLYFESYFNDPYVSINARFLLQASSFEALLDLPEKDQRKIFKRLVQQYTVKNHEKTRTYYSERTDRKEKEIAPYKVIWADKFYTLRNHIIHGGKTHSREFLFLNKQHHMDISPLFFVLLVKELLNEKLRYKKKYFMDNIVWEKYEDSNGEQRFGFVYFDSSIDRRISRTLRRN